MVSVSRIAPVAALVIWICSLRPFLSQSSAYSAMLCALPSLRFTAIVKLVARIPCSGDAIGAVRCLERPRVGRRGGPREGCLPGGGDRGIRRDAGRFADHVVPLTSIGAQPVALRSVSLLTRLAVASLESKNSPLMTAFGPEMRVARITTFPLTFHWRYSPLENDEMVSVSRIAPLAALVIWICSLRPLLVPIECVQRDVVRFAVVEIHAQS